MTQATNKNIVICFDGTGNEIEENPSNVLKLYRFLNKDTQSTFYDPGVGTISTAQHKVIQWMTEQASSAFGHGLQKNLIEGYLFIMDHYQPGDKIYLFGFSRGAYTARSLAGFIYRLGLLRPQHKNLIAHILDLYNQKSFELIATAKKDFARDCQTYFIGVWDTVGSLGKISSKYKFYDPCLNPDTQYGYHAVSIDEKRKKFPVSLWSEENISDNQTITQMWFAGVHSDIGGGYVDTGLSAISLEWMIDKAADAGLQFTVNTGEIQPNPLGKIHQSREGFWKLWEEVDRKIPFNARIHDSVYERMEKIKDYRPVGIPPKDKK